MKRSRTAMEEDNITNDINQEFIDTCQNDFDSDPMNIVTRNAVVSIGSMLTTVDSKRLNTIDHVFMNSLKKKNLKSTNQGQSGRCWLYGSLNMFRHSVIKALGLTDFEFSETYLFFWDKLERSNMYLRFFIDNPNIDTNDRLFNYIVKDFTGDGGHFSTFINLVKKYGVIPKNAMKETFQSECSSDMNDVINEHLQACANNITKCIKLGHSTSRLISMKDQTVKQIYNILVKFLGEPPKRFRFSYVTEEDDSNIIDNLTPTSFKNMMMPDVDFDNFVVLTNIPTVLQYNKTYEIKHSKNVYEGRNEKFLNLPINELSKYTTKSVLAGIPVWIAVDMSKNYNPYHSTLDDKLVSDKTVFGDVGKFSKGDRIAFNNTNSNHAMTIVGVNIGHNSKAESYQVENSWGSIDHDEPGLDGFLYMSHSWFEKNLIQVVVHKNFLSRSVRKLLDQEPIQLEPWTNIMPALFVKSNINHKLRWERFETRNIRLKK